MLKLKLKEVLLAQGKRSPQAWLQAHCNLTYRKAYNLINHKQKSISFEDLSKICMVLECTPNELFWWVDTKKYSVTEWHPCKAQLNKPAKDANWTKRVEGLNPERVDKLREYMEVLEAEKMNEAKKIYAEVHGKVEEKQEDIIDTAPPME